jgi:hypothetical protein
MPPSPSPNLMRSFGCPFAPPAPQHLALLSSVFDYSRGGRFHWPSPWQLAPASAEILAILWEHLTPPLPGAFGAFHFPQSNWLPLRKQLSPCSSDYLASIARAFAHPPAEHSDPFTTGIVSTLSRAFRYHGAFGLLLPYHLLPLFVSIWHPFNRGSPPAASALPGHS